MRKTGSSISPRTSSMPAERPRRRTRSGGYQIIFPVLSRSRYLLPANTLHYAGEWGGLSYDRQTGQLYISDEDPTANTVPNPTAGRHIIQLQMSADGKRVASTVNTYTVDQLVAHTADPNAYPLGTAFDLLPVLSVTGTTTHALAEAAFIDLLARAVAGL